MAAVSLMQERRERPRRQGDEVRAWLPVILSIVSTIVALMLAYGRTNSRLDLIEYRLMKIEQTVATPKGTP